jgi:hypothetical protein
LLHDRSSLIAWRIALCPPTLRTSAKVSVRDDLANGAHLDVNDALELRARDAKLPPSFVETTLNASESCFACLDWQLGYLSADALRHRPATFCCLNGCRPTIIGLPARAGSRQSGDRFIVKFRSVSPVTRTVSRRGVVCPSCHTLQEFERLASEIKLLP